MTSTMPPEAAGRPGRTAEGLAMTVLAIATAAAWIWMLRSTPADAGASMSGMTGMSSPGSPASLAGLAATALAMTAAMMIPVATPVLIRRRSRSLTFTIGYLAPWLALATALTWLGMAPAVQAMGSDRSIAAAVLAAAGLFQLSPAKAWALGACARAATTPAIASASATLSLGLRYGLQCLASGGPMMLAASLLSAMSPAWMAALALLMMAEKTRAGRAVARTAGVAFVAAAGLRLAI